MVPKPTNPILTVSPSKLIARTRSPDRSAWPLAGGSARVPGVVVPDGLSGGDGDMCRRGAGPGAVLMPGSAGDMDDVAGNALDDGAVVVAGHPQALDEVEDLVTEVQMPAGVAAVVEVDATLTQPDPGKLQNRFGLDMAHEPVGVGGAALALDRD